MFKLVKKVLTSKERNSDKKQVAISINEPTEDVQVKEVATASDQVLYSEEKVPEEISNIDHPKCFDIPNSSSSTLNTLTFKAQRDRTEYRNNTNLNETMGDFSPSKCDDADKLDISALNVRDGDQLLKFETSKNNPSSRASQDQLENCLSAFADLSLNTPQPSKGRKFALDTNLRSNNVNRAIKDSFLEENVYSSGDFTKHAKALSTAANIDVECKENQSCPSEKFSTKTSDSSFGLGDALTASKQPSVTFPKLETKSFETLNSIHSVVPESDGASAITAFPVSNGTKVLSQESVKNELDNISELPDVKQLFNSNLEQPVLPYENIVDNFSVNSDIAARSCANIALPSLKSDCESMPNSVNNNVSLPSNKQYIESSNHLSQATPDDIALLGSVEENCPVPSNAVVPPTKHDLGEVSDICTSTVSEAADKKAYSVEILAKDDSSLPDIVFEDALDRENVLSFESCENPEMQEPKLAKGTYTMDFDKFDDPNFDPFKSTKTMMNSPTNTVTFDISKQPEIEADFVENDISKHLSVENNFSKDKESGADQTLKQIMDGQSRVLSKVSTVTESTEKYLSEKESSAIAKTVASPASAYAVNASDLDDPNFDLFENNKRLLNGETETNKPEPATYSVDLKNSDFNPFTSKAADNSTTTDVGFMESRLEKTQEMLFCVPSETTELHEGSVEKSSQSQPGQSDLDKENSTEQSNQDSTGFPLGTYTMDFSKFDDPNFNPFKSNKALVNDNPVDIPKPGTYTMNFDQFEDPNFDPFISNKGIMNSPTKDASFSVAVSKDSVKEVDVNLFGASFQDNQEEADFSGHQVHQEALISVEDKKLENADCIAEQKMNDESSMKNGVEVVIGTDVQNFTADQNSSNVIVENLATERNSDLEDTEQELLPPKGSYTIDFSKFDDPNFDPFKTNKGLVNDVDEVQVKPVPGQYSLDFNNSNLNPFKSTTGILNSPVQDPPIGQKKTLPGVSDFDPFQSFKENLNSPSPKNSSTAREIVHSSESINVHELKARFCDPEEKNDGNKVDDVQQNTTPTAKTELKAKTKKNEKPVTSDINEEEVTPALPKGAYTIDFSKFDDPDFDPFKTNKGLVNDVEGIPEKSVQGQYTLDFNDPNLDPFKSTKGVSNSPVRKGNGVAETPELVTEVHEQKKMDKNSVQAETEAKANQTNEKSCLKASSNSKPKKKKKKQVQNNAKDAEDEIAPPKGAYSMDFSKFDDPNFDPFKTNKGLVNDVDEGQEKSLPGQCTLDLNDASLDPLKSTKGILNSPVKESRSLAESSETAKSIPALDETKKALVEIEANVELNTSNIQNEEQKKKTDTKSKLKKKQVQDDAKNGEDEIAPPKGAYTMDFSKFDDPNFDPFKTNKGMVNDVDEGLEKSLPGQYTLDLNDASLDPFKSTKGILNSPVKESRSLAESSETVRSIPTLDESKETVVETEAKAELNTSDIQNKERKKKTGIKFKLKKKKKQVQDDATDGEDEIAPPKGAYTMDFSKFDDPNFDPFKTNKGLVNDINEVQEKPVPRLCTLDLNHANLDPFKSTKGILNSPVKESRSLAESSAAVRSIPTLDETKETLVETGAKAEPANANIQSEEQVKKADAKSIPKKKKKQKRVQDDAKEEGDEIAPPKGAYSIDFSKFDDPNFDPFKTNKGLVNDVVASHEKPVPGQYTLDFNDSDLDPFKSTKGVLNSPVKEANPADESFEPVEEVQHFNETEKAASEADPVQTKSNPVTEKKKVKTGLKSKPKKKKPAKNNVDEEESEEAVPKGSYTIDFSQFDDPDFDPFKSKKSLVNDVGGGTEAPTPNFAQVNRKEENADLVSLQITAGDSLAKEIKASLLEKPDSPETVNVNDNSKNVSDFEKGTTTDATSASSQNDKWERKNDAKTRPKKKKKLVKKDDSEQQVQEAPLPKGSYTIDFSKFDDPNFDPFKSTKGLSNDDASENVQPKTGSYTLDLDKFDDPNFDPFKAKKSMVNSPVKESNPLMSQASEENSENLSLETKDNNAVLDSPEKQVPDATETNANGEKSPNKQKSKPKLTSGKFKKKRKPVVKTRQEASPDDIDVPKGAYSIDFSKFDNPNFNPFESKKTLVNDSSVVEEAKPKAGGYATDFDKFDDPNFDPFKSSRNLSNDEPTEQSPLEKNEKKSHLLENNKNVDEDECKDLNVKLEASFDNPATTQEFDEIEPSSTDFNKTFSCGTYSVDPSSYDDPNFNPFKSSKGLANSPTKKEMDENVVFFEQAVSDVSMSLNSQTENTNHTFTSTSVTNVEKPSLADVQSLQETGAVSQSSTDEEFYPAEEVLGDENSMIDFWSKQNADSENVKSDLRKQSLYVQFDPLVQSTVALENAISQEANSEAKLLKPSSNAVPIKDHSSSVVSEDRRKDCTMASEPPHYLPAVAQLTGNLPSGSPQSAFNLISFSPSDGDNKSSAPSGGEIGMPQGADSVRYEVMKLLQNKEDLLKKKATLNDYIIQEQMKAKACKATLEEVEKMVELALSELESTRSQEERMLEDIASAKRVYQEYHSKANDLLPVLKAHKQGHQELRSMLNRKMEKLREKSNELQELKQEAHDNEIRLANELAQIRSTSDREVSALQAKLKMEQMTIASLTSSLQDKARENAELTKICDELIAGAES